MKGLAERVAGRDPARAAAVQDGVGELDLVARWQERAKASYELVVIVEEQTDCFMFHGDNFFRLCSPHTF